MNGKRQNNDRSQMMSHIAEFARHICRAAATADARLVHAMERQRRDVNACGIDVNN